MGCMGMAMRKNAGTITRRWKGMTVPYLALVFGLILVISACSSLAEKTSTTNTIPATVRPVDDSVDIEEPAIQPVDAVTPTSIPAATASAPSGSPTPSAAAQGAQSDQQFFIELIEPNSVELVVDTPELIIGGLSMADALITVNDDIVFPDNDGLFGAVVILQPGPNIIEIVGSVFSGESDGIVLTAVYLP